MKRIILFSMAIFLSSCQVYRSSFDDLPGEGIPGRSVTEIEGMIIESDKGPDILVERDIDSVILVRKKSGCEIEKNRGQLKRIWVPKKLSPSGYQVGGHWILFKLDEKEILQGA